MQVESKSISCPVIILLHQQQEGADMKIAKASQCSAESKLPIMFHLPSDLR